MNYLNIFWKTSVVSPAPSFKTFQTVSELLNNQRYNTTEKFIRSVSRADDTRILKFAQTWTNFNTSPSQIRTFLRALSDDMFSDNFLGHPVVDQKPK